MERWPTFAPKALALGFRSVNAFPLRLRKQTIGGLNVFHGTPELFSREDSRIAQALADAATIGILQRRAVSHGNSAAEQLQHALDSRIVIEQAKGMLAEFASCSVEDAFLLLRKYCRDHNVKLGETARQVTERAIPLGVVSRARRHEP